MAKHGCDFLGLNRPTLVLVKQVEGSAYVRLIKQFVLLDGCCAPFLEVDLSVSILVSLVEDFNGALIHGFLILVAVDFAVDADKLVLLDQTIAILVKLVKRGCQFFQLLPSRQMGCHKSQRCLLQLRIVLFKKIKHVFCQFSSYG